jgi:hypothetical protein
MKLVDALDERGGGANLAAMAGAGLVDVDAASA